MSEDCKAIVSAVDALCGKGGKWSNNYTLTHFVDIFKGSESKKIMDLGNLYLFDFLLCFLAHNITYILGHNKHALHGRGKSWQRNDVERLMRLLVMKHYLDEELVITKEDVAIAYLRIGSKARAILSGEDKVHILFLFHLKSQVLISYF